MTTIRTLCLMLCFLFITSCNDEKKEEKTKDFETEIPDELSEDEAVKEYFSALDKVVNEYVNMVEEMAEASKEAEKSKDEGFGDAMNMLTKTSTSMAKMAPLLEKMDKLEKEAEIMKDDMTQKELEAFMSSYLKLINRFQEASSKINQIK